MCSPKTMLKIGLVLAVILGGGFLLFPQFRPVIIGIAPFALFALCPLAMFFMGGKMGDKNKNGQTSESSRHEHKT